MKYSITVLIVAKCIVNRNTLGILKAANSVLIVAKCIVNISPKVNQRQFFQY